MISYFARIHIAPMTSFLCIGFYCLVIFTHNVKLYTKYDNDCVLRTEEKGGEKYSEQIEIAKVPNNNSNDE